MSRVLPKTVPSAVIASPTPPNKQVAALCWRKHKGHKEVLLITSRDSGRWVVPKGWPIAGLTAAQSALQEAWEEAGVRADADKARYIGRFTYDKGLDSGKALPVEADLFKIRLRKGEVRDNFPEAGERRRLWVAPRKAAKLVAEPDLQEILRKF
ncbi:NUDIX hydrolase [Roseovarius sp.]|uniref:NUDIX hydrolase n=1 Tax=Roseovarius sp. TaxID=1486281 RepID=UPI003A98799C